MADQVNAVEDMASRSTPSYTQIFLSFLWLGLTSFGGPVAHIGYFRVAFVERNQWISATDFQHLACPLSCVAGTKFQPAWLCAWDILARAWWRHAGLS
jgi:hypothetical protein